MEEHRLEDRLGDQVPRLLPLLLGVGSRAASAEDEPRHIQGVQL